MSEHDQHPEPNPDAGHPSEDPLPDESPTAGEAALDKDGVEFEDDKAGRGGGEQD